MAPALDDIVEPTARGDPGSPLRWTCKSARILAAELTARRHPAGHTKVAQLLREDGYSLRAIARPRRETIIPGEPVISVATKKKELIGNYQNQGRQWRKAGTAEKVNGRDFPSGDRMMVKPGST